MLFPLRVLWLFAALFSSAAAAVAERLPVVAAFGDSLSAGYYLEEGEGFAPALQRALEKSGAPAAVRNAAVSGDTSGDALQRVAWMLRGKPDLVIVELGANDMLRGFPPSLLRANLEKIILQIKKSGAKILLAGMLAPPNMGEQYGAEFAAVYAELAAAHNVALFPFFLQDVAGVEELNLNDGMHPNADGVEVIVQNILPQVTELLGELSADVSQSKPQKNSQ